LPAILTCSNVIVNIADFIETTAPTPYYNYVNAAQSALVTPTLDNTQTGFCMGSSGSYVVLQLLYPLPLFTSLFSSAPLTVYQGQKVRLLFSTAAFRNEPFPTPTFAGC
jgi:pilus assembly protein Flp/PilA